MNCNIYLCVYVFVGVCVYKFLTCERWVQQRIFLSPLPKWFSTGDAWSEDPCPNLAHPDLKEENQVKLEMNRLKENKG